MIEISGHNIIIALTIHYVDEPMLLKVRFHGRGGHGVKTASRILGEAAFNEGLYAQDSPIYGAERRGAPVAAFTRISDEEILERGFIFDPDIVVVMDETLLNDWSAKPLDGLKPGGIAFVNTTANSQLYDYGETIRENLVIYDLTGLALKIIGKPIISTPSAAAASKITGIISESSLIDAVTSELSEIGVGDDVIENNIILAREVFRSIPETPPSTKLSDSKRELIPLEVVISYPGYEDIVSVGNSPLRKTGNWRVFKPIVDFSRCTACGVCFVYCPDAAITLRSDGKPEIDYDNCKGCLICYRECPPRAISIEREVRVW